VRQNLDNILLDALDVKNVFDWEKLEKNDNYSEQKPEKPTPPIKQVYPNKPEKGELTFSFSEKLFKFTKELKIKTHEEKYLNDLAEWEKVKTAVDQYNQQIDVNYAQQAEAWEKAVILWEQQSQAFYDTHIEHNNVIKIQKHNYLSRDSDAIQNYFGLVLNSSKYPEFFPRNFEYEYNPDNKLLIVEYELPSQENLPSIKEVKYIAVKNELIEIPVADVTINKMYDEVIYKIALRALHELFVSDEIDVLDVVSFNGWVTSKNRATGKEENNCILSIQVKKTEFKSIDLRNVDPKTCFRALKGVSASKLSTLTPVQPILQITRKDRRFVDGYSVEDQLTSSTNLAAMDWQDFENLIRELFEKEFKTNGGDVKITQASRDGGVDAVAFDPDPIRGGKIVIQAKRYTNTVSVSAVRDLYGTVMNEGAIKGILVTTSDFGADSHDFAKDKPLTLLSGSNLLHLLEKHGHHAKIDLREAKRLLSEENK